MSNVDTLCDAVRSRSVVELTYDNQIRVVNPHVVWIKQDDERTVFCSCWQVLRLAVGGNDDGNI